MSRRKALLLPVLAALLLPAPSTSSEEEQPGKRPFPSKKWPEEKPRLDHGPPPKKMTPKLQRRLKELGRGYQERLPPMKVHAETYREDGPALRLVSQTATGHSALTPDGGQLIYLDRAGLFVLSTRGGKPRKLAATAPYFRFTPDGKYVLLPGAAWTRLSLRGKDGPLELAQKLQLRSSSGGIFSNDHVAFITSGGPMAVASILEGSSILLDVGPPSDRRCHGGAGAPRSISADGQWLLFQHGCYGNEIIRVDGSGRRALDLVSAIFVDDYIVGSVLDSTGKLVVDRMEVLGLSKPGERWSIEGTHLGGQARRVPGRLALVQNDPKGRLVLVDLEKKKVRVLHEGGGKVTSFVEVSPDGRRGLYSTHLRDRECSVHQVDLKTGKRQRLARVEGGRQCFIRALGKSRAVLYAWRSVKGRGGEALVATIDLKSGVVRRLQVPLDSIGNLHTAGEAVTLNTKGKLYLGRP